MFDRASQRKFVMQSVKRRPRILFVDDEVLLRLDATDFLEEAGFQVFVAEDAGAALCLLRGSMTIDGVITDVQMPGLMDGLGLSAAIKGEWPEIFIIVASGIVTRPDCSTNSEFNFIRKPYNAAEIVKVLNDNVIVREDR
jgi:two-component system, response regulator PdtaR